MKGVVIKSTGSWYQVLSTDGVLFPCRIRGNFKMQDITSTNPVCVGDKVDFVLEKDTATGVITHLHQRKNYIVRKSVNLSKKKHILASNIDTAFLVVTVQSPVTTFLFTDRFLTAAQSYQIPVVLIFNKTDILDSASQKLQQKYIHTYRNIGYVCLEISALNKQNLSEVKRLLKDKVSLFSGHSGVGKSTLINAIEPALSLKTAPLSTLYKQGKHTTTFAQMYALSFGGFVVDTPGIKGFGMVDFQKGEVANYFREFFVLKPHCKFYNCKHINEPQCAVKKALQSGTIAQTRYDSYLQMVSLQDDKFRR